VSTVASFIEDKIGRGWKRRCALDICPVLREEYSNIKLDRLPMEKIVEIVTGVALPEFYNFLIKSGFFLIFSGAILYLLLFAIYPPIHDSLHNLRHSLAIVPCH
jgi:hypothetical protein